MNLYTLSERYRLLSACVEGGVETDEELTAVLEELDTVVDSLDIKVENIVKALRMLGAFEQAARDESRRLNELATHRANAVARLRGYTTDCLLMAGVKRVQTPIANVHLRKHKTLELNEETLGDEWIITTTISKPDKESIARALENGKPVPGAFLVEKSVLVVK